MSRRDAVRAVRMRYFDEPYPASTLVKVAALVDPRALVEIEALAMVPRQDELWPNLAAASA